MATLRTNIEKLKELTQAAIVAVRGKDESNSKILVLQRFTM